jgi:glycosyltransferase involved in cell wall biosynthesis
LPAPFFLSESLEAFRPQVIHSHHPFLLGNTALRLAARHEVPLVYTFHTFYEHYLHYVPGGETEAMKRFVAKLVAGYANLCDHVIAPSGSVAKELAQRGVHKPIDVIPTGVDCEALGNGDGPAFRRGLGIPAEAFVVGFVSRLAKEKNLAFLCGAVIDFLSRDADAWFLLAGSGPFEGEVKARLRRSPARRRVRMLGNVEGRELAGLYRTLDAFVFASHTETQGLVVAEAMAAGIPVIALRAPGVEDVVQDAVNGRLLENESIEEFSTALVWLKTLGDGDRAALRNRALATAHSLSEEACATKALALYENARREFKDLHEHHGAWDDFVAAIAAEWDLLVNLGNAAGEAFGDVESENPKEVLEE